MLFPFSLEGAARIWLEREPPRLIFTWDDLVSKFINQFFPPSKTTNLRNEITNFQQRFDKSFSKAWDRFKDLLRACPHRSFSKLHQLDTFYNALNSKDQDLLNSAAGGNFLDKMPRECLAIIESKSKVRYLCNKTVVSKVSTNTSTSGISPDVVELKDMVKALLLNKKIQNQSPATVKAVEESCVTCGGNNFNQGPVHQPPVFQPPAYQTPTDQASAPQIQGVSKEDFSAYVKANDAVTRNRQTQGQNMQNQLTNLTDLITKFVNSNRASSSSSGTLPSNIIANPRSDLKAITTRSVNPTNNGSTEDIQPPVVQSESLILNSEPVTSLIIEPVIALVSALKPNPKASILYPSKRNDERNREKSNNQIKKFYQIFKDMSFEISFADSLILMPKFASTLKASIGNKEKMAECLALVDLSASINLMPLSVWKRLSLPELTMTCMTLELAGLLISHPVGVAKDVYVKVGSFYFPADFVVVDFDVDPRVPLILGRSFLITVKSLIDVFEGELTLHVVKEAITLNLDQTSRYSANYNNDSINRIDVIEMACKEYSQEVLEVELKDLPPHLKYAFLEGDDKLPVIIAKDLSMEEKTALITDDFEPAVQHQRRVNPKIYDVIKQEVIKLLDAGLIYPISDSPWVSPVHCVPKKGGFTVVEIADNELILTCLVTGWRVCIDYRKLNEATRKDHFHLLFMDQMLERLAGNQYYCFLDGFLVISKFP
uniref:DNA-directed DNA polymerase n=1 Tax=Tanacetum cinerariifolium TaxID=118510 RepID=A0A6L2LHX4_TANCI|nr:DNA-directed DNA polymerase [Tanacetum cinerariifolium]